MIENTSKVARAWGWEKGTNCKFGHIICLIQLKNRNDSILVANLVFNKPCIFLLSGTSVVSMRRTCIDSLLAKGGKKNKMEQN